VYSFTSNLPILNSHLDFIRLYLTALNDDDVEMRRSACQAFDNSDGKAAINEIMKRLVSALGNTKLGVGSFVCEALGKMSKKAATNEVINIRGGPFNLIRLI
jgi:hypothetical protein